MLTEQDWAKSTHIGCTQASLPRELSNVRHPLAVSAIDRQTRNQYRLPARKEQSGGGPHTSNRLPQAGNRRSGEREQEEAEVGSLDKGQMTHESPGSCESCRTRLGKKVLLNPRDIIEIAKPQIVPNHGEDRHQGDLHKKSCACPVRS